MKNIFKMKKQKTKKKQNTALSEQYQNPIANHRKKKS
jgi:hypothetical protein